MRANRTEEGQALVMIVFAVVAMFGFAALAVDLGNVFAERRRAQSAADASVFAVAWDATDAAAKRAVITEASLLARAKAKAKQNGFEDLVGPDPTLPLTQVLYYHPPTDGPYVGNKEYYQVKITTTVSQSFSQFIFTGSQRLTVEAVARARPVQGIFPGDALHATNQDDCKTVDFAGTGNTTITGGNVFSNSQKLGCVGGVQNGSGSVVVSGGNIVTAGGWSNVGSGTVSPAPTPSAPQKPMPDVPYPDCSGSTVRGEVKSTGGSDPITLNPGIYSTITINGGDVTMNPGMYCLDGDFSVGGNSSLTGNGVFIVMRSGSIDFMGGGEVHLTRPSDLVDYATPPNHWGGMLIYMPANNLGGIDIGGNADSSYTGTILAPGPRASNTAKCNIHGTGSSIGLSANIICDSITVTGTARVDVNFNEKENYRMPPIVELAQ